MSIKPFLNLNFTTYLIHITKALMTCLDHYFYKNIHIGLVSPSS